MPKRPAPMSLPPSTAPSAEESILPLPAPLPREALQSRVELAHELGEIILVLLRVGTLLACSGAAAFRVREAMQRTALAFGTSRCEFVMTIDFITASIFASGQFRTQTVRLPPVAVDMNLLCRLEVLTRALAESPNSERPSDLHAKLDELQGAKRLYPRWVTVPALGAACAAFCAAGHGNLVQIACAFAGAAAGHTLRLFMLARHLPLITVIVSCAFVSCAACEFTSWALGAPLAWFGRGSTTTGIATISSVLYLIPGVPLVTSLIDLVHLDVSSGVSRAAYASLLVCSIFVGVFAFIAVAGLFLG